MSELKHTCCAEVGSGFMYFPCGKTAKVERDNKWYCGTHDPVAVRERQVKRNTEWRTKIDAVYAAQRKRDAEEKETKRRADLYPELLDALKGYLDTYPNRDHEAFFPEVRELHRKAVAAIEKAEFKA